MINLVPAWWLAAFIANVAITAIEYFNRAGGFATWREAIWTTGPFILVAQWALFYTFRDAPSLMLGWWVFAIGSTTMRLLNSHFLLGEPLNWQVGVGVVFVLVGGYFVKAGV